MGNTQENCVPPKWLKATTSNTFTCWRRKICGREANYGRFSSKYSSVQLLSRVWVFVAPWTAAHKASLYITTSWNVLKLMSIESVIPSNHLILVPFSFGLRSFPASGSFPMSQFFTSGGQSIEASASALVLTKNIWGWFPLELRRGTVISKRKESVVLDQDTPDLWVGVGGGKRTAGVFIMQIFSRKREEPRGPKRLNYPVSADQKILNWLSKIPREGWNSS